MFTSEDMGLVDLKGIPNPVRAHVVLESTGVRGRLDASAGRPALMIGRQQELTSLGEYWQQTRLGRGQVVLISGDAGIGKSRLVRRFTESVTGADAARAFEWRCSPFHTSTPFHPIVDSLEHHLGAERGASRDQIGRAFANLSRHPDCTSRRSRIWPRRRTSSARWCLPGPYR